MHSMLLAPPLAAVAHGVAVPLLWIVGLIMIVAGVFSLIRHSMLTGVVLIVIGVLLGGLNVL